MLMMVMMTTTFISNSNNINNSKNENIDNKTPRGNDSLQIPARNNLCNQPATSNLANVQVNPRKPVAELLDAPVHEQILWDAAAAVSQLGQTPAIKQVIQPDFVVEPAAHLIVGDKSRGLGT